MELEKYTYSAYVKYVYDGDTITCDIDCGFGLKYTNTKIRLYGIDTPELRGDEYEEGIKIRDILREKISCKDILIRTIKDKTGKYGRYLGIIYFYENGDYLNINDWLVENGYAKKYRYI